MTKAVEWEGPVGDSWAAEWRRTDRSLAGLASHLDAAILERAPFTGTAVDIGCGAGATSIALADALPDLQITGIDLSPGLIAIARERGGTRANLSFATGPAESVASQLRPVDFLFSRHGVMFFDDPVRGFAALRAAAAPGAALVFSCFCSAAENPWATEVATAITGSPQPPSQGYLPGPFAFADAKLVGDLLASAGWQSDSPIAVDFRYQAGGGEDPVADALGFFQRIGPAAPLIRAAAPHDRAAMLSRLCALIARRANSAVVDFPAAAWLWSAHAL